MRRKSRSVVATKTCPEPLLRVVNGLLEAGRLLVRSGLGQVAPPCFAPATLVAVSGRDENVPGTTPARRERLARGGPAARPLRVGSGRATLLCPCDASCGQWSRRKRARNHSCAS